MDNPMRPSFSSIYMRLAMMMAERSTCKRLQVGCAIVSIDYRYVYGVGYNGNASGLPNHCDSDEVGKCGCFVEGTLVFPAGLTHAYRRRYEGDVIRVVTTAGEFSVTPNHPVLAPGLGWVSAESLKNGSRLLGTYWGEGMSSKAPHYEEAIPIEKVFDSLAIARGTIRCSGASYQFHGDGIIDEHVDVVSVDGSLCSNAHTGRFDYLSQPSFTTSDVVTPQFGGACECNKSITTSMTGNKTRVEQTPANHDGADFVVARDRNSRLSSPISIEELVQRKIDHALALVPVEVLSNLAQDSCLAQSVLNGGVGHVELLSKICNALSFPVASHEVLYVERYGWSGHVYNLSTKQNWYNLRVGGIIAHNCLHAEENAIINCTVDRDALKIVYTTDLPCPMCAKRFINLGNVVAVYYARPYRIEEGANILRSVGIVCEQLVVQHPLGE